MPPQLAGMWPYTKRDALKHIHLLYNVGRVGRRCLSRGELEGLNLATIRDSYESGGIPKQIYVDDHQHAGPVRGQAEEVRIKTEEASD